jgi:hypothetical protein
VQQRKARFQFLLSIGDLQDQPLIRRWIAIDEITIDSKTPFSWEDVEHFLNVRCSSFRTGETSLLNITLLRQPLPLKKACPPTGTSTAALSLDILTRGQFIAYFAQNGTHNRTDYDIPIRKRAKAAPGRYARAPLFSPWV